MNVTKHVFTKDKKDGSTECDKVGAADRSGVKSVVKDGIQTDRLFATHLLYNI